MPTPRFHRFRVFTLARANVALSEVRDATDETRYRLERLRVTAPSDQLDREADHDRLARELLEGWAERIRGIGAAPKGIFTVDFQSRDPNVLWCWAPQEDRIGHRHFVWQSFKDRISINAAGACWPSLN